MLRLRNILIYHKVAIILAFLTAVIASLPQIYFRIDHKDDGVYQGIELLPDSPWSARVREVQDGHPNFGSIYFKDGKDSPYLFQPLGSMTVGYMGKMFSLDINDTLLFSRLVLPFLTFLLCYGFVFRLSRDKLVALSGASMILLADHAMSYSGVMLLLQGLSPGNFLELARPVNTAMIYIPFFGFLISFWQFYQKQNLKYGVLSAVLLGLNFYNYFYTWTYLYAFGSVLVLFLLIGKEWRLLVRVVSVFLGAVVVAIPYGINLYRSTLHPAYEEVSVRFGVVASHAPLFVGFGVVVALVVYLIGFPREDNKKYLFGLAMLLAPLVTMNQQILTGKVLQPAHYHWYFHKPIAVIFILIVIFYYLSKKGLGLYKEYLAFVIIAASILTGIFTQAASYFYDRGDGLSITIERQKYGPVMKWLSQNVPKEEVVLAHNEASHMTVIYTPLNVFYHRAGIYSLPATTERLLDAVFTFYRLRGINPLEARDVFFEDRGYLSSNVYGMHYREVLGSYAAIPDEKIEEILSLYVETATIPTVEWMEKILNKYDVSYIIWDKKKDSNWQLNQYKFLKEVAVFDRFSVYQFLKNDQVVN